MSKLRAIAQDDLADVWPWVRKGLVVVQRRGGGAAPEDVYHALRNNAATLAVYEDVGFVVLQVIHEPNGARVLFVWAVYGKLAPVRQELLDELDALARQMKAKTIRHVSPRRWDATGDFELKRYVYEREVL